MTVFAVPASADTGIWRLTDREAADHCGFFSDEHS